MRMIRLRRKKERPRFREELRIIPRWLKILCVVLWLLAVGRPTGALVAAVLVLLAALLLRAEIVRLPHLVAHPSRRTS